MLLVYFPLVLVVVVAMFVDEPVGIVLFWIAFVVGGLSFAASALGAGRNARS